MAKRSSKKREHDFSIIAHRVVEEATAEPETLQAKSEQPEMTPEERHAAAVALGRLGGRKGGPARAKKLTPEQRRESARRAAQARWNK